MVKGQVAPSSAGGCLGSRAHPVRALQAPGRNRCRKAWRRGVVLPLPRRVRLQCGALLSSNVAACQQGTQIPPSIRNTYPPQLPHAPFIGCPMYPTLSSILEGPYMEPTSLHTRPPRKQAPMGANRPTLPFPTCSSCVRECQLTLPNPPRHA